MSQGKIINWNNPAAAVARDEDIGFSVDRIETIDTTAGGSFRWIKGMPNGSYLDVDAGTIALTNGFTPVVESAIYGAAISAFTNANPGVITVGNNQIKRLGIKQGDVIKVTAIAESSPANTGLNATYTVASINGNTITTATNTTAFSVYVSGGFVTRISYVDDAGKTQPAATQNIAIEGMQLGTAVVGGNNSVMVGYAEGSNNVV